MDIDGALLTPEGTKNVASLFGSPVPWLANREVVVVEDYTLRAPQVVGQTAMVTIEYRVWGAIDSSLKFIRQEGMVPDEPVKYREYDTLALTDRQNEMGENGRMTVQHGQLAWRIQEIPSRAHVSVAAAMSYLTQRRGEPIFGENADKAIVALKRLSPGMSGQRLGQSNATPTAIVAQFCDLDAAGKRLTSDGRREMSRLLIPGKSEGTPQKGDIVRSQVVGNAFIEDETTAVIPVEYFYLGELDLVSGVLHPSPVSDLRVRAEFRLVRTNGLGKPVARLGAEAATGPPGAWKIETHTNEPHISVETALRYITSLRDNTTSGLIRGNADKTLLTLERLNKR
jgi:hypothetical protein